VPALIRGLGQKNGRQGMAALPYTLPQLPPAIPQKKAAALPGRKSSSTPQKDSVSDPSNPSSGNPNLNAVAPVAVPVEQLLPLPLHFDFAQAEPAVNGKSAPADDHSAGGAPEAPKQNDASSRPTGNGTGPAVAKPEIAFAARVQPASAPAATANNTANSHTAPEPQAATASPAASRRSSAADAAADAAAAAKPADPAPAAAPNMAAAYTPNVRTAEPAASSPAVSSPAAAPVQAAAQAAPAAHPAPVQSPAPLKDISLNLTQPGAEKVEVRVVQQGGEVRVAVRTADPDLTNGLRQGVHELAGRLEDNGYRAETWRPAATASISSGTISQSQESHSASSQSQSGNSDGRQNGPQQDGGQRNQNPSNRPRWVEEMENSVNSAGEPTGDSNGIGS